ncbi:sigma-54-dependent transcriptional regulator [Fibrobacterota bacterium]
MRVRILLVDDDQATLFGFSKYLSKAGYDVQCASSLSQARETVTSSLFDTVIRDLNLPDGNGLDWIPELRKNQPDIALIVITGRGDIPSAVEAMRRGADNYLTKPVNLEEVNVFLQKSLELKNLRRKDSIQKQLNKPDAPYWGRSQKIKSVKELASLAADNETFVMLQGETGTGKGLLSKWIHERSSRRNGPFVEINCSGLRGELLNSELFGHVRGAFTSAVQDREGLVGLAHGGTLFLDEIGDMELSVQAQFLKTIEEKSYRRLGESKVRNSDFRLICATNHDLSRAAKEGGFRQDLYFRICVFPLSLPPLRDLTEDLQGLTQYLLSRYGLGEERLSDEVMEFLKAYHWPGNIRELKNILERAALLARGENLRKEHFTGLEPPEPRPESASFAVGLT